MSATDWEEIKRLAADFQRAQLTSSVQRLSEQNCIDIINRLINSKQLEVVFTTDGKEYITPQHLVKEIKDELFVHQGRINLVELAKILSVDLSVISVRASELEKSSGAICIVNGQLIHNSYLNLICEEINEKLKIKGRVTITELTGQYDLPSDFILNVITKQLGKIIKAQQDPHDSRAFFTEHFKKRSISLVKGGLLAITKPTSVSTILSIFGIEEHLFYFALNYLNESKETSGSISGKEGINSIYTPAVYTKSQFEWVKNFYAQNGYLEYSALSRIGISNPVKFVEKNFQNLNLIKLDSCAVGQLIFDQVEAAIDDVIQTATLVNILPILPTVADEKDAEFILHHVMKKKSCQSLHIFNSSVVVTDQYLRNLMKIFDEEIEKKAKECVSSGAYLKFMTAQDKPSHKTSMDDDKFESKADKKEERRKKASEGKGGGGTQGRETKTKSTKKKYGKTVHNDDNSDDDKRGKSKNEGGSKKLEILDIEDIKKILNGVDLIEEEDSEELVEEIANHLYPKLHKQAQESAKTMYESTIAATNQNRRKKYTEMQDKLNDLILKIRLFERGYKQFPSKDVQQQLAKYLLKTICTDVTNEIFTYVVQDDGKFEGKEMTNDLRTKIVNSVPNDQKDVLNTLNKSLSSSTLDDFLNIIEDAVGPGFCDVLLKKTDKKKERSQLLERRQQLLDHINVASDSALVLQLASLIVFQEVTQTMLHASGRFVSTILPFLEPNLPADQYSALKRYHDLVLKLLTTSNSNEKSETQTSLEEEMASIKEIAVTFKKNVQTRD
ncbi:hypothetical protein RUM43_010986 [Polyplax serrata]|uniref:E3 UFM1-protein ligase 1 homolog n=1 Tax=Polyplax serrata TaxID=468196 RepID=A0AAN8P5X5_POLSC